MPLFSRRMKRAGPGRFRFRISPEEREFLRDLPGQMREILTDPSSNGDPALQRLFPPAYGAGDQERNREYASLVRDDLVQHRLAALAVVEETLDRDELTEEQMLAWMGALNDARLVLGTRLDVAEDMDPPAEDDPDFPAFFLYSYLSQLQAEIIDALQS